MRSIVISAVNIVEGGALTVLRECLISLAHSNIVKNFDIIVLVNSCKIVPSLDGINYIEYPRAKKHYYLRFYYEYYYFNKLSKRINPYLWLSLHDMSPYVRADRQAVYMHNPTPFYKPQRNDWRFLPINALWAYLYKYIYKINIRANNYLVVQQEWLRNEISRMFNFDKNRIVVARPEKISSQIAPPISKKAKQPDTIIQFIYPAFPRVFKNFEVVCEAARILEQEGVDNIRISLTIDGSENKYSRFIIDKYKNSKLVDFVGLVDKSIICELYDKSDCLIFPSKLETWGLPLSEFKPYGKPIIAADLPYAHESVAGAPMVRFFNPNNAEELSACMKAVANGNLSSFHSVDNLNVCQPFSNSWDELFALLLK